MKPLKCESGFFLVADISQCEELIPNKFIESHDFEEGGKKISQKNRYLTSNGKVPLDLAFCRWMAVEYGLVMMPCSLFYHKESPYRSDKYVRIAICKGLDLTTKAMDRLLHPRSSQ